MKEVRRRPALAALVIASLAWMVTSATTARGAVIAQYNADPDNDVLTPAPAPTDAAGGSWTLAAGGTGQPSTTGTPGTETPAGPSYWQVTDTVANGHRSYVVTGAAGSPIANALTHDDGWRVSFTLKVLQSANPTLTPPSYNVPTVVDVRNGSRIYDLAFVNDGTNEAVYHVPSGTTFNNANKIMDLELDAAYHTFDMIYDKAAAQVKVYLDGGATPIFTFTDANSNASATFRVFWGSGLQGATQNVRWQNVLFETGPIPEPASLALLGAAGLILACRPRARR